MNSSSQQNPADLLGMSYFAMVDREMLDAADAQAAKDVLSGVVALVGKHHEASIAIKGDGDLSDSGRKSKLAALTVRSDQALDALTKNALAKLEEKTQTLTQSLANAASLEPTVSDIMLMIERRAFARELDPLIVQTKLLELAGNGKDDLSVIAIITAPAVAPLVQPDIAARAKAIMGARLLPDQSKALNDARNTLAVMENAIASAKHAFGTVQERNFLGVTDPIAIAANGSMADALSA